MFMKVNDGFLQTTNIIYPSSVYTRLSLQGCGGVKWYIVVTYKQKFYQGKILLCFKIANAFWHMKTFF